MRIISGTYKGKSILSPSEGTRPSTDRTRQALFSLLQHIVPEARVLDLFAGSGVLGLECLSRGAVSAIGVELDRRSCQTIQKNIRNLGVQSYTLLQRDVLAYLDSPVTAPVNLIFADPPYEDNFATSLLLQVLAHSSWETRATADAYFIAESPQDLEKTGLIPDGWKIITTRSYGKCHITVLQRGGITPV